MSSFVNTIWQKVKRFGFVPQRPYETTAPIYHQLTNTSLKNLLGWKPFATFLYAMPSLRKAHTHSDTNERIIEIPWIFSQFDFLQKSPAAKKILDIGWLESTVSISLATAGFDVTGIDIRAGELHHPNLQTVVGDICQNTFANSTFDSVILLSTLEHIGLDTLYGKAEKITGDQKALDECLRILKPGGSLLLTTPVAATVSEQPHFMRIYSPQLLKKMLGDWHIDSIKFFAPTDTRTYWHEVTASALPHPPHFGVALIKATKSLATRAAKKKK